MHSKNKNTWAKEWWAKAFQPYWDSALNVSALSFPPSLSCSIWSNCGFIDMLSIGKYFSINIAQRFIVLSLNFDVWYKEFVWNCISVQGAPTAKFRPVNPPGGVVGWWYSKGKGGCNINVLRAAVKVCATNLLTCLPSFPASWERSRSRAVLDVGSTRKTPAAGEWWLS